MDSLLFAESRQLFVLFDDGAGIVLNGFLNVEELDQYTLQNQLILERY